MSPKQEIEYVKDFTSGREREGERLRERESLVSTFSVKQWLPFEAGTFSPLRLKHSSKMFLPLTLSP